MRIFRPNRAVSPAQSKPDLADQLPDIDQATRQTIEQVRPFTMTSPERIAALCNSVEYICHNGIRGDIVECGVWRGGSILAAIQTLLRCDDRQRPVWLYDTFDGMTEPSSIDVDFLGRDAKNLLEQEQRDDPNSIWCCSQLEQVRALLGTTGYPTQLINYVEGPVEQTIPAEMPRHIALLRLDTDWYDSTRHELVHLLPRLVPGGVLIIDDYGHWEGCRRAVDEFFREQQVPMLLNRIDYTGRIGIMLRELTLSENQKVA